MSDRKQYMRSYMKKYRAEHPEYYERIKKLSREWWLKEENKAKHRKTARESARRRYWAKKAEITQAKVEAIPNYKLSPPAPKLPQPAKNLPL